MKWGKVTPTGLVQSNLRKQPFAFLVIYAQNMSKVRHSHNHSKGGLIDAI